MELSSPKNKNFLIFSQKRFLLIFLEMKLSSLKPENTKRILYLQNKKKEVKLEGKSSDDVKDELLDSLEGIEKTYETGR